MDNEPLKLIVRAVRWALAKQLHDKLLKARQEARLVCTPKEPKDDRPDPSA